MRDLDRATIDELRTHSSDTLARRFRHLVDAAENRAMAVDGPVSPTSEMMEQFELEACLRIGYVLAERAPGNAGA